MSTNVMIRLIPVLTEPFVRAGLYPSQEQALKHIILDYIERQIVQIETELRGYEQKYQQSFAAWTQALSGRASIADEDDWLEWEALLDMRDSWRQIKQDVEQSNV